jgi:hypothetical protein
MPLSLDTLLVQPSNSGSFTGASGTASLPTGTTAGSTVLICVGSTSATVSSTGFTDDSGTQGSNTRTYVLRKSNVGAGETSWTLTASVNTMTRWTAYEVAGLDPDAAVDVKMTSTTSTTSGTTASTGTLARSTTYDGVVVALHAVKDAASTTPPTLSGHTNGMTEMDEGGVNDGVGSVGLSVSMKTVQALDTFGCVATSSITLSSTSSAGATIVCYTAQGAKREPNIAFFWGFFPGVASTPAGLATGNAGNRYFETMTGSPAITADGLQLTGSASIQNVGGPLISISGQTIRAHLTRIRFRLDSVSGDLELATLDGGGGANNTVVRYVSASQKLGVKVGSGTEVLSDATVTTGQFYNLDLRVVGTTTAYTCDWQLDYGAGPIVQTQATFTAASGLGSLTPILGWTASSTGTVTYAYAVYSVVYGHYPLGDHTMVLLVPDPAATPTLSGTATNFNTFTANGTMAAWNATTARNAIDEAPPTVGASADGFAQVTAASSDYVEVPMQTYQAVPNGGVRAVRMLACGWAASATAATIGFRGYEGSAETFLFAAADPNFDNTSTPAWVCKMYRPTNGWTQAKLDALAFRVGFSDDATPDVGIHALYAEVAVQTAAVQAMFGTTGDVQVTANYDPLSGGILGLSTTTPEGKAATLHYEVSGSPTDVSVAAASSDSRTLDAPDAPTVGYVAIYPDPEGVADT